MDQGGHLVRGSLRSAPTTRRRLFVAATGALIACGTCSTATGYGCATSVSALAWSIWVTPVLNATELKVGEELNLGLLTFNIGCTTPSYDEVWSQSNPTVARLTQHSNGNGATIRGLAPGTTVVTGEAVGADGRRGQANQTFRILP